MCVLNMEYAVLGNLLKEIGRDLEYIETGQFSFSDKSSILKHSRLV